MLHVIFYKRSSLKRVQSYKRSLFTLVELLVVTSVLLILMSLLTTTLRRVVEHGESVKCTSNLNQLGIATHLYSNDANNYFVTTIDDPVNAGISWDDRLAGYDGRSGVNKVLYSLPVGSPGSMIYDCPTDIGEYAKLNKKAKLSYGINMDLSQSVFNVPQNYKPRQFNDVVFPDQTILLLDFPDFGFGQDQKPCLGSPQDSEVMRASNSPSDASDIRYQCSRLDGIMGIHSKSMNYGMVDGHVEILLPLETERPYRDLFKARRTRP